MCQKAGVEGVDIALNCAGMVEDAPGVLLAGKGIGAGGLHRYAPEPLKDVK